MKEELTDTYWVKEFIHRVFTSQQKDVDAIMARKFQFINKPFYKYCYVCENAKRTDETCDYNIHNFDNDELYFQNPALFNDPFDCFLGFSQTQLIKNLLITTMKQQGKYTPEMRKAINMLFIGDKNEELLLQTQEPESIRKTMQELRPMLLSSINSEQNPDINSTLLDILMSDERMPLFIKILQNKITVADQQAIIDLLYANDSFRAYTKPAIEKPEYSEKIIEMAKNEMKYKVETTPSTLLFGDGTGSFQLFDFFDMMITYMQGKEKSPELLEIKKQFAKVSDEALEKSRQFISEHCRVTCLSESMDSPLMWSHYANKHHGFCLEYDFTHTMIKRYPDLNTAKIMLLPVIYSEKRPLLSKVLTDPKIMMQYIKTKKLPNEVVENMIYGLLFKSLDWSYEKEWRIIGVDMKKTVMKLPVARKLFLGANIEEPVRTRLIEIAQKKHIPVFQMMLCPDKYKFEYFRIL